MLLEITTLDTHTLDYSETGSGTPVFFLPGGGASYTYYTTFLRELEKEFRVIAINYPGYDKTPSLAKELSIDHYAKCMAAAIESFKFKKNFVVAHSMGSGVTLKIAEQFPKLISKATLISPMLRQFPLKKEELARRVALNAADLSKNQALLKDVEIIPFIKKNVDNAAEALKQLTMLTTNFTVPLTNTKQLQKLIVLGTKDVIFPYEEQLELTDVIPNKTIFSVDNGGHDVIFSHKEKIIQLITEFFPHKV